MNRFIPECVILICLVMILSYVRAEAITCDQFSMNMENALEFAWQGNSNVALQILRNTESNDVNLCDQTQLRPLLKSVIEYSANYPDIKNKYQKILDGFDTSPAKSQASVSYAGSNTGLTSNSLSAIDQFCVIVEYAYGLANKGEREKARDVLRKATIPEDDMSMYRTRLLPPLKYLISSVIESSFDMQLYKAVLYRLDPSSIPAAVQKPSSTYSGYNNTSSPTSIFQSTTSRSEKTYSRPYTGSHTYPLLEAPLGFGIDIMSCGFRTPTNTILREISNRRGGTPAFFEWGLVNAFTLNVYNLFGKLKFDESYLSPYQIDQSVLISRADTSYVFAGDTGWSVTNSQMYMEGVSFLGGVSLPMKYVRVMFLCGYRWEKIHLDKIENLSTGESEDRFLWNDGFIMSFRTEFGASMCWGFVEFNPPVGEPTTSRWSSLNVGFVLRFSTPKS